MADDVSLLVVLIDTNPYFWSSIKSSFNYGKFLTHVMFRSLTLFTSIILLHLGCFGISEFLWNLIECQVLSFLNSILLLNQLNQVVVIATGFNSCSYVFDSSDSPTLRAENMLDKLENFVQNDESLSQENDTVDGVGSSLLSGALSLALCCILVQSSFSMCFCIIESFISLISYEKGIKGAIFAKNVWCLYFD